ncbi:Ribosome biogenesis protein SLX9 domain containing protein [Elaphomyces granulatus]
MARIRPEPRSSIRRTASGRGRPAPSNSGFLLEDGFRTTKRDKRIIKHSTFMSRVEKSHKKTPKRRRPSKKLVTNLHSLADALPASDEKERDGAGAQVNMIKRETMKHRPGATKRREKVERMERERFLKNLADMTEIETKGISNDSTERAVDEGSASNRWVALRNFISQTMEQQPAFQK